MFFPKYLLSHSILLIGEKKRLLYVYHVFNGFGRYIVWGISRVNVLIWGLWHLHVIHFGDSGQNFPFQCVYLENSIEELRGWIHGWDFKPQSLQFICWGQGWRTPTFFCDLSNYLQPEVLFSCLNFLALRSFLDKFLSTQILPVVWQIPKQFWNALTVTLQCQSNPLVIS